MSEPLVSIGDLDALIEEALSEEPFLKAPVSLRRDVDARVRLISLRDHEQRRFRISMVSLIFTFVGSVSFAGLLLWFTNLSFLYSDGVSGGKGWFDYYANAVTLSFSSYQGGYSLLASFILALVTLFLVGVLQIHKLIYSE
jgi:uncharacterized membrane protein YbjE (DUF340 family)